VRSIDKGCVQPRASRHLPGGKGGSGVGNEGSAMPAVGGQGHMVTGVCARALRSANKGGHTHLNRRRKVAILDAFSAPMGLDRSRKVAAGGGHGPVEERHKEREAQGETHTETERDKS
jgi:hypothetical protein